MIRFNLSLLLISFFTFAIYGQAKLKVAEEGVTINNTSSTAPHASAVLDVESTSKGVLFPRLTSDQRDQIANPTEGLMIYNLESHSFEYFDGAGWVGLNGDGVSSNPSGSWIESFLLSNPPYNWFNVRDESHYVFSSGKVVELYDQGAGGESFSQPTVGKAAFLEAAGEEWAIPTWRLEDNDEMWLNGSTSDDITQYKFLVDGSTDYTMIISFEDQNTSNALQLWGFGNTLTAYNITSNNSTSEVRLKFHSNNYTNNYSFGVSVTPYQKTVVVLRCDVSEYEMRIDLKNNVDGILSGSFTGSYWSSFNPEHNMQFLRNGHQNDANEVRYGDAILFKERLSDSNVIDILNNMLDEM